MINQKHKEAYQQIKLDEQFKDRVMALNHTQSFFSMRVKASVALCSLMLICGLAYSLVNHEHYSIDVIDMPMVPRAMSVGNTLQLSLNIITDSEIKVSVSTGYLEQDSNIYEVYECEEECILVWTIEDTITSRCYLYVETSENVERYIITQDSTSQWNIERG